MKRSLRVFTLGAALSALVFSAVSCGGSGTYTEDAAGFEKLGADLVSKFGADAWYTDFHVSFDENAGAVVGVTETADPASLKMEEWVMSSGSWRRTADVTMEIDGADPEDFMFQLDREVSLGGVGAMIEQAKAKLTAEKGIADPGVDLVSITTPDDEDKSATRIFIILEPANGGTSFKFFYNLEGELLSFDY